MVALLQRAGSVRRRFEALCQDHELTLQQFNVLRILRGAENAGEGPLPTMAVAQRMIEPEPGITRMMGRLERKGLVAREHCGADARRILCRVTPAGLAAVARLDGPVAALDDDALRPLSNDELAMLAWLLDRARGT